MSNELAYQIRKLSEFYSKMAKGVSDLQMQVKTLMELSKGLDLTEPERIERAAARVQPKYYNIEIPFTTGTTARTTGSTTTDATGYFLLTRIYFAFRVTLAGDAELGKWRPMSSGHPAIASSEQQAAADMTDTIDFSWNYSTGASDKARASNDIPGDLTYREDRTVVLPCPDIIVPASTVFFTVVPHKAVDSTGTMVITLCGKNCMELMDV